MRSRFVFHVFVLLIVTGLATFGCGNVPTSGADSIYVSAETGDVAALRDALGRGFDVNKPDDEGMTLLHHAAIGNQVEVVEMLINDYSARPGLSDSQGRTPLDVADEMGNDDVAITLEMEG
jgi:ankyrin repeat protein